MYDTLLADLGYIMPISIVALFGLVMVVWDAFHNDSPAIPLLAGLGLAIALVWEVLRIGEDGLVFAGTMRYGGFAAYANTVILIGALLSILLSVPYLEKIKHNYGEVHALILFATVGMMVLASSNSLITIFVGLETMSICLYVLTGLVRDDLGATESALKYFLLGAFSTGFFLYGIALLYAATGTMYLDRMAVAGAGLADGPNSFLFWGGIGLLLIGFLFKISAVPFHMWTPDAYQGAPTTITGFMSTASKTAAFAALILVLAGALPAGFAKWGLVLAVIAALTMVVGNLAALAQDNVKRMLAYSSVAHAGYILTGLAAGTGDGYSGALYYLLAYTLMNIGAFGVLAAFEWDDKQGGEQDIQSLAGAGYRKPILGVTMGVFMFGLIGFPPLGGFIGKYKVFAAAIDGGLTWLAIVGVLASAASAYYYLRILVFMWMKQPEDAPVNVQRYAFSITPAFTAVLVVVAVLLLVIGLLPGGLLDLTRSFFPADVTAMMP